MIERVNQRVSARPTEAPTPAEWRGVNAAHDEYRHVQLTGRYLSGQDVRVQAVTTLGSGFWLLSPLELNDGSVVLINRGFVPPNWTPAPSDEYRLIGEPLVNVTGLLRLSEPHGGFLRSNDPAAERWFSRDVTAIAEARGLHHVAPYFVDAEATASQTPEKPTFPVGGLTVIAFHNSHLVYALTWFTLAFMVAGAGIYLALQNAKQHDDTLSTNNAAD